MSAQIVIHPRSNEPIACAVMRLNDMGYCLRNFHGSAFIHAVPMLKTEINNTHPTITWLKELQR